MFGIIYLIIFIITTIYSIEIIKKSENRIIATVAILFVFVISFIVGTILGNESEKIYAKKHFLFDPGVGHTLAGALEGIVFIPFFVTTFIKLYRAKKLKLFFASIYCIEVIIIWQELFFLLMSA